jgi:hypothetical protein
MTTPMVADFIEVDGAFRCRLGRVDRAASQGVDDLEASLLMIRHGRTEYGLHGKDTTR